MSYTARMTKSGNIKVGNMWTFNKLAGAGIIAGCKGTCGKHCEGCYNPEHPEKSPCYVFKSYRMYGWEKSSVVKGHVRNTNIMRSNPGLAFKEIREQIKRAKNKPSVIRIHASGELETTEELMGWLTTATMFPDTTFYLYTKAYEVVDGALSQLTEENYPHNFFINMSIWHNNGIAEYNRWKHFENVRAYVYVDRDFDYYNKIHIDCKCPAYDEKGKLHHDLTCDKCKICFQKKAKVCSCYAH